MLDVDRVLLAALFVGGAVVTYIAVLEEEKESGLKSGASNRMED